MDVFVDLAGGERMISLDVTKMRINTQTVLPDICDSQKKGNTHILSDIYTNDSATNEICSKLTLNIFQTFFYWFST